jgi:hypothetical protein
MFRKSSRQLPARAYSASGRDVRGENWPCVQLLRKANRRKKGHAGTREKWRLRDWRSNFAIVLAIGLAISRL